MPSAPTLAAPRLRAPHLVQLGFFMCFMAAAPIAIAQTAIHSIANVAPLPLRNIQIEVRQVQQDARQQSGAEVAGRVELGGRNQGQIQGRLESSQTQSNTTASQQALVLNGRSTQIALRTSVPLRVVQTWMRNGALRVVPSTVLLEAGTGFMATPRWDGGDTVELEIGATQSGFIGNAGGTMAAPGQALQRSGSSATSTVVVTLGEWTTLAQTEQDSEDSRSTLGGREQVSGSTRSELQVRLSVR